LDSLSYSCQTLRIPSFFQEKSYADRLIELNKRHSFFYTLGPSDTTTFPMRIPDLYKRLLDIKKDYSVDKKMRVVIIGLGQAELPMYSIEEYFCPQFIEILAALSDMKVEFTLIDCSNKALEIAKNPYEYEFHYSYQNVDADFEESTTFREMRNSLASIMIDAKPEDFYNWTMRIFKIDRKKLGNISIYAYKGYSQNIDYGEGLVDIIISTYTLRYVLTSLYGDQRTDLIIRKVRALKPWGRFLANDEDIYPYLSIGTEKQVNNTLEEIEQAFNIKIPDFKVAMRHYGKIIEIQKIPIGIIKAPGDVKQKLSQHATGIPSNL